jgi:Leucine-rich repeat (LRR) protein
MSMIAKILAYFKITSQLGRGGPSNGCRAFAFGRGRKGNRTGSTSILGLILNAWRTRCGRLHVTNIGKLLTQWRHKNSFKGPPVAIALAAGLFLLPLSLHAAIPAQERNALIDLYNSTNGANWADKTGWLGAAGTECSWFGVTCDTDKTSVTRLSLTYNQLSGNIPSSLGNLANLQYLLLDSNNLSGSIPSSLGNLANLVALTLSFNQLNGSIPSSLDNLANLQELVLSNNQLSGSIPSSLGNLANLQYLDLHSNHQLSGSIPPELGNLANLQHLYLDHNQLSGSIPTELGNLANLQDLYLDHSQLSGSIPTELGNLANLQNLDLYSNQLSGSIPPELGNLANLEILVLGSNQLSGSIPPELGNLANLKHLSLYSNQLSGSIPPELGNLANLKHLFLGSNQLSGSVPTQLTNLASLSSLDISWNALYATDANLVFFLNSKQPGWQNKQTVAPMGVSAVAQSSSSILVTWTPIIYTTDAGRYEVYLSTTSGGPYTLGGSTSSKSDSSILFTGLNLATIYYIVVRTVTDPHAYNQNTVTSEYSPEVFSTTLPPGTIAITVTTSPASLSVTADGTAYITPHAFYWVPWSSHTIGTISPQGSGGTRYVFASWSDGGVIGHTITVPASVATYTANFTTQYLLTTVASPTSGGAIIANPMSADGFYDSGTFIRLTATPNAGYDFSAWSGTLSGSANPEFVIMWIPLNVTANFLPAVSSLGISLSDGGVAIAATAGTNSTQAGYATVTVNSGAVPYATAVFSFKQKGVTVTEAGVPASPPTTLARVFIDYRSDVLALPGQSNSGLIDINTGIAVVNNSVDTANVTYTLRDTAGNILSVGNGTIAAGAHFAKFIDQLTDVGPNFNLPSNFQHTVQFASLEIASDEPLSVLALRGTNNQRNDFLITTTPIADLTQSLSYDPVYFPQFADGGGYTTSLVLLNTTNTTERGTLQILDNNGSPLVVHQVGGTADSSFRYAIPAGGAFRFQTDGSPAGLRVGWVRLIPYLWNPTPISSGVFSYNPGPMLISESGIPSAVSTTHARIYVDLSGDHNTGLAIANVGSSAASITLNAFQNDGVTPAGTNQGPLQLPAYGHDAEFADQFIAGLPAGFTGVLDISSVTPFAALTMRSLVNERDDFLMTTFPIADANATAPSPIVFPQVADGGGYVTQFIFISPTGASSATLSFWDEGGAPLPVGL